MRSFIFFNIKYEYNITLKVHSCLYYFSSSTLNIREISEMFTHHLTQRELPICVLLLESRTTAFHFVLHYREHYQVVHVLFELVV